MVAALANDLKAQKFAWSCLQTAPWVPFIRVASGSPPGPFTWNETDPAHCAWECVSPTFRALEWLAGALWARWVLF